MSITPVHWHEGLFLQPHHLQRLQRLVDVRVGGERAFAHAYPYGVLDLRLSTDALANGQVKFDRLHAVTRGGVEVCAPETADLPALDVRRYLASSPKPFTVCLGVPLWHASRANTADPSAPEDPRDKRIYRVAEEQVHDENTGENAQSVQVRRLAARLLVDMEDTSDLDVLPLVRIGRSAGQDVSLPRPEPRFIPACLRLSGSVTLRRIARDLADFIETVRQEQALQLRPGWSPDNLRGPQVVQVMRLMALNRFAARMPALLGSADKFHGPSPLELYMELRGLLGELVAFHADRDPFEAAGYDHDNLGEVFEDLNQKIRFYSKLTQGRVKKVVFKPEDRDLVAEIEPADATEPKDIFLGIKTKMDTRALAQFIEDPERFKMMPFAQKRLKIFGVKLEEERHPPMELGTPPGQHYFRLNRSESQKVWDRIATERKLALVWPEMDRFDYEEVALHLTYA